MTDYWYRAYGLVIRLPFACPALLTAEGAERADVSVVERAVPTRLEAALVEGPNWQATAGRYLLRAGSRAGRFLVEGGDRVDLQRAADCHEPLLAFHFVDTVLAAILRHRGLLVLHAASAATPGGAVVVSGWSGAGKSTALCGLVARGCAMLADDVTAVRRRADGGLDVLPGATQVGLCHDAAARLGTDPRAGAAHPYRGGKLAVPMREALATGAAPLRALYLLEPVASGAVTVARLAGVDKFAAVQESAFGPLPPGESAGQFALLSSLSQSVEVFRIQRPPGRWTADQVVEALLG